MRHIRLYIFLLVLVLIAGSCGYVYFFCKLENVEVKGASYYTDSQVRNLVVTSKLDEYAPVLYLKGRFKTIEAPFIEKIDIELIDKNSVRIEVYEKVITACVEKMGQYFYFDNDGTVMEVTAERNSQYPLVKGVSFASAVIEEKLEIERESVFDTILELAMLLRKNNLEVEEIEFSDNYEVTLHIGNKVVYLGKQNAYDLQIDNLPGVLEAAGSGSYSIDMKKYSEKNRDVIAKPLK